MDNGYLHGILLGLCLIADSLQKEHVSSTSNLKSTRIQRQADEFTCILPQHPENGRWSIVNGAGAPGGTITENTIVKYECNRGHILTNQSAYFVCNREEWNPKLMPDCEKLCPPLRSTFATLLTCKDKNEYNIPCDRATEGSYLTVECAPYYETPFGYKKNLVCLHGSWDYPKPVCQPVCGKKTDDDVVPLIFGGKVTKALEYPWVTTLYSKVETGYENVCGGSIISQRAVLTAAHCVTNEYGDLLPSDNYQVAAGKLFNKYKDSRDKNAQYVDVSRIIVHSGYKGESRRFLSDIAIIITRKSFVLSNIIQPVCFNNVNSINLHTGKTGVVCGFGVDESGFASEQLRSLEIPYKYETTCALELPKEWTDKYYLPDKICAGFLNKNMSVCRGDSGNGLAFRNPEDNRYYIHGIVSVAPSNRGECDFQQNSLYTNVVNYYAFIDKEISKYSVEDCVLPAFPKNGSWVISNQNFVPGDSVSLNTVLRVSCNQGFGVSPEITEVRCDSAADIPKCLPLCPALNTPAEGTINCQNQKGAAISCSVAPEGTILKHKCSDGTKTTRTCKGGSWGAALPKCQQIVPVNGSPIREGDKGTTKVICSYASWQSHKGTNPEDLDAGLCDYVTYAFVGLRSDGKLRVQDEQLDLGTGGRGLYYRVTDMKKLNPTLKVFLSVGGSSASNASLFSSMAASSSKRSVFAEDAKKYLQTYNFDGLDIEWLVPAVEDKVNYISLLKDLRRAFQPHGFLLTGSVRSDPGDTGYDGSQMAQILDWVNVRTYDMTGVWNKRTGQNSPLYASSTEYDWEKQHLNVDASGKNWIAAGVPKNKLVLGIAFYGRSFTLRDSQNHGIRAPINGAGPGEYEGFLRYSEICEMYSSWTRVWDNEQKNPYKYSDTQWFGYDDSESVLLKAQYIKNNGFLGVNMWPVDGDDVHGKCGEKQILLKSVHRGLRNLKE